MNYQLWKMGSNGEPEFIGYSRGTHFLEAVGNHFTVAKLDRNEDDSIKTVNGYPSVEGTVIYPAKEKVETPDNTKNTEVLSDSYGNTTGTSSKEDDLLTGPGRDAGPPSVSLGEPEQMEAPKEPEANTFQADPKGTEGTTGDLQAETVIHPDAENTNQ